MGVLSLDLLLVALRRATPVALVALGETFSERGGIINIGVEGTALAGALIAALVTYFTGNAWLGIAAAVFMGMLLGLIHAVWCVYLRADHVVTGAAINILIAGLALFITVLIWDWRGRSASVVRIDPMLFTWVMLGLVVLAQIFLFRTRWGLRLRVVGEHPQAADTAGVNVYRTRVFYSVLTGALCGLAGAFLLNSLGRFTAGLVGGRGFIGIAAMVVGKYRPVPAFLAAYLFGFVEALSMRFQVLIPSDIALMLPYVMTVLVLAGFLGRTHVPTALGKPYIKDQS